MIRRREIPLHLMLLPSVILVLIFAYAPMAGIVIAFQDFMPAKGILGHQDWIGLDNFMYLLSMPDIFRVLWNTIFIAILKMIAGLVVPITIAILLNEVNKSWLKRSIQTIVYLPNFMSWVILAGITIDMLSPSEGIVNQALKAFGIQPIFFLADNKWFVPTLIVTDTWKNFGFATIVYMAAITGIDPVQYESALIDGAGRWKQTLHVTLPGMRSIIVLISVLSLGSILNAGFEQIFNLYNPVVLESGDILDTLLYRVGIQDAQYGVAAAMGLFKSVVSTVFISISYFLAYKVAKYRIF